MASFLEKLKSSMGVEEEELEEIQEEKPGKKPAKKKKDEEPLKKAGEALQKKEEALKEEKKEDDASDWFEPEGELAVDVYQTDENIVIQSTIAGVKPEDLDIAIENDTVTISGERKNAKEDKGKNYFYQECFWGAFSREIILPEEVDASRAEAVMKDGVFTLTIPKLSKEKVKKVKVRV